MATRTTSSRGTLRSITPSQRIPSAPSPTSQPSFASAAMAPMGAWGNGKPKIVGAGGVGSGTGQVAPGSAGSAGGSVVGQGKEDVHPLKHDWTFYYVHRPPGAKVIEYEKEIKTVATFGSTESFWTIYSHILRPSALPAVTDLLMFASHVRRPVWEELPNGGKWVVRLRKGVADRLWEDSLLSLLGDQFDEEDGVVGVVLSVRSQEDILSIWSDRERAGMGEEGRKDNVRDKLITLLGLPPTTPLEYKSNKALLEGANTHGHAHPHTPGGAGNHERHHHTTHHHHHRNERGGDHDRHHYNNHHSSHARRDGANGDRERRQPKEEGSGPGAGVWGSRRYVKPAEE